MTFERLPTSFLGLLNPGCEGSEALSVEILETKRVRAELSCGCAPDQAYSSARLTMTI